MRPVLVTAPTKPVLTMEEVKDNLRIAHDDDHTLLSGLVAAVTSYLDGPFGILRNCLLDQVWEVSAKGWRDIRLGLGNVQSIDLVKYWPEDGGAQVTLDPSAYRIDDASHGSILVLTEDVPAVAARRDAVTAHFKAGYGDKPEKVPMAVRQAMHLLVGHYYKHSEAVITGTRPTELPMGVQALIAPYRFLRV